MISSGMPYTTLDHTSGTTHTDTQPFDTRFVRDEGYRYEFTKEHGEDPIVIWTVGGIAKSWWSDPEMGKEYESILYATAVALGVSGGSSHRVPSMLLHKSSPAYLARPLPRAYLARPSKSELLTEEKLDGKLCYKVDLTFKRSARQLERGEQESQRHETVWIDQGSFLLLKVHQSRVVDGPPAGLPPDFFAKLTAIPMTPFTTESTTTYRPDINGPISTAELSFRPPRKK